MATYLTLEEVRDELDGVAKATLAEWRADGRFPRAKKLPNGRVLIARGGLDTWLEGLVSA